MDVVLLQAVNVGHRNGLENEVGEVLCHVDGVGVSFHIQFVICGEFIHHDGWAAVPDQDWAYWLNWTHGRV
jgi:hypothetical protein